MAEWLIMAIMSVALIYMGYALYLLNSRLSDVLDYLSAGKDVPIADEREFERGEYTPEQEEVSQIADELSDAEKARLERDYSFDERIRRIKDELANEQVIMKRGTIAEETHPLVKNLPHNIIPDTKNEIPDVEYID